MPKTSSRSDCSRWKHVLAACYMYACWSSSHAHANCFPCCYDIRLNAGAGECAARDAQQFRSGSSAGCIPQMFPHVLSQWQYQQHHLCFGQCHWRKCLLHAAAVRHELPRTIPRGTNNCRQTCGEKPVNDGSLSSSVPSLSHHNNASLFQQHFSADLSSNERRWPKARCIQSGDHREEI